MNPILIWRIPDMPNASFMDLESGVEFNDGDWIVALPSKPYCVNKEMDHVMETLFSGEHSLLGPWVWIVWEERHGRTLLAISRRRVSRTMTGESNE